MLKHNTHNIHCFEVFGHAYTSFQSFCMKLNRKCCILTTTWQCKKNYALCECTCPHSSKLRHRLKMSCYSPSLRITALGNAAGAQRRETSNTGNLTNFTASIALDNRPAEPWPPLKANILTLALQYVQNMPVPSFRKKIQSLNSLSLSFFGLQPASPSPRP